VKLPARSPNLNAFAERFMKSIKEEWLSRMTTFAHPTFALYVVRVPRTRALLSASFPSRIAATQLPFSSGFLSSRSLEDFHLQVTSRFAFAPRLSSANHTNKKEPPVSSRGLLL